MRFIVIAFLFAGCSTNPCTRNAGDCFSIQGLYSYAGCPGQYSETVVVNGTIFPEGCWGKRTEAKP